MGAAANIVINNGSAVATTFEPFKVEGDTAVYVNRAPGTMNAWHFLRITRKLPADRSKGVNRVRYEFEVPTIDPTTKAVLYVNRFVGEYYEPVAGTTALNTDIHAYNKNFLATTVATDIAVNGVIPT
ncbi:MAG: hypothetical protein [Sanya fiers-like virus 33]|nr:MAG: hypothetical protein [Sanya fiers-like virus 33]